MNVSIYKSISDTKSQETTLIDQFLADVKNGKWMDRVLKVRETKDPELKKQMPIVTISGRFKERNRASIIEHSGFICIDIDNLDDAQITPVANQIWNDTFTYACFKSIRGSGLAVLVKIDPARHEDAFEGLERYYAQTYQISIDRSCKDVSRARFVSYDPHLYENKRSQIFKKYVPKKEQPKTLPTSFLPKNDIEKIVNYITSNRVDITCGDYRTWLHIGFALADYFDEAGRAYFHSVSQFSEKYKFEVCDKQYTACLKGRGSGVKIGTFIYHCQQANVPTQSGATQRIVKMVEHAKKQNRNKESVAKTIVEMEGVSIEEASEMVDKAFDSIEIKTTGNSPVDVIELFVNTNYKLQFNTITKRIENNGEAMDGRTENSMYINLKAVEPKISQDLLTTYLRSHRIPEYNPLQTFLQDNQNRTPQGVIKSIADCIKGYNGRLPDGDIMHDYVEFFLTKFYLGLIAGALGDEIPPLVPVLYGNQVGTGKTEIWRKLLPKELRQYYQESNLSRGQDDEILMSMKWIVCDDEWRGRMGQDSRFLKSIAGQSSSTIRRAYARDYEDLKRIAMLCGTSNDSDIIQEGSNRRIVPINCTDIDLDTYYQIDKTDALMEAYHLYTSAGDTGFLSKSENELLRNISIINTTPDIHEEMLLAHYEPCEPEDHNHITLTATEIASHIQSKTQLRVTAVGIGRVLNRLNFQKTTERMAGCSSRQVYFVKPLHERKI